MRSVSRKKPADFWFLATTIILVIVGVLLVFDSSYAKAGDKAMGDAWYYVKRQMIFAAVGFGALFAAMRTHPKYFRIAAKVLLPLSLVLLILVLIPGIGKYINGARRWIPIGPFHLQPSELAKLAVILFLADKLAAKGPRIRNFGSIILNLSAVAVVVILVLLEPDMGTAVTVVFIAGVMFYVGGMKKRHILSLAALGALLCVVLVFAEPYRLTRVQTFFNPGSDYYKSGYQITHSLIALATGGITGTGLCEGRVKFFIPTPQTDMIAATLAEETGLIGMLLLLALFIVLTYRGLSIGHRSKSAYMGLLAIGITSLISLQALVNIAVLSASLPATGVPLPFISYGGSHLIVMLLGAGMVLSVSRHVDEQMPEPELEAYESRYYRRRDRRTYISCTEYRPGVKKTQRRSAIRR